MGQHERRFLARLMGFTFGYVEDLSDGILKIPDDVRLFKSRQRSEDKGQARIKPTGSSLCLLEDFRLPHSEKSGKHEQEEDCPYPATDYWMGKIPKYPIGIKLLASIARV